MYNIEKCIDINIFSKTKGKNNYVQMRTSEAAVYA